MTDTDTTGPPLLLIDVDGPLNPYAAKPQRRPEGYTTHRMRPRGWDDPGRKPLRVWLDPAHGAALRALPFELVWATTWEADANTWIAPRIGLPELPYIAWDPRPAEAPPAGIFWKTRRVVSWAAGRPFAWIDDEITDRDREFVADHHPGPALLHHVDPRRGLLPYDFARLAAWAGAPRGPVRRARG
ncbi:hypothetical protein [Streptomyces sp. Amel2xC10]|uniref:hypothetical protein n=1 Tax=Streptomyces sp. Amel2xC10 TaxID=1305826 RepID=UPI000A08BB5B|nr:hypothetical protein [Streptomyces sp. Amel2xC10]SME94382.1 hypothetical protein SAMN02745830_00679 [Streptomyces sp. Amel2xC10]